MPTGEKDKVWELLDRAGEHLTKALEQLSGYSPYDVRSASAFNHVLEAKKDINELKVMETHRG